MIYDAGFSKETFSGKGPTRERLRTVEKQPRNVAPYKSFSPLRRKEIVIFLCCNVKGQRSMMCTTLAFVPDGLTSRSPNLSARAACHCAVKGQTKTALPAQRKPNRKREGCPLRARPTFQFAAAANLATAN